MTTMNNGTQRKQLSTQLDRLDTILDGLADAIPEVIAQTVRDAVQAAVTEVLTNPVILEKLRPTATVQQPVPPQPSPKVQSRWQHFSGAVQTGWTWLTGRANAAWSTICQFAQSCAGGIVVGAANTWTWAQSVASSAWALLVLTWALLCHFRKPLLIASGVGVVVGVGCYFAGPAVASTVSGIAGFAGSLLSGRVRSVWSSAFALNSQQN